jgi:hypothetical protein
MNVNVIVLNVHNDFRPAEAGDHGRYYDEQCNRPSSKSATITPVEEVIELLPQNGTWVGKRSTKAARAASYSPAREPRSLHAAATFATYDRTGNIRHSSEEKGNRVNITA